MNKRTWLILGATSLIAEEFAKLVAKKGGNLILVGRNEEQLELINNDIKIRFPIQCDFIKTDFQGNLSAIISLFETNSHEIDLFIAYSSIITNQNLTAETIKESIETNILSTIQLIHSYLAKSQKKHRLIFLSSVAGCRGRAKNSLYGATKKAIEIYLEGLQQENPKHCITIAKLGFIDTNQTFGEKGIFYAANAKACARACLKASNRKRFMIYYPFFWRFIMGIILCIPNFIYKRMRF